MALNAFSLFIISPQSALFPVPSCIQRQFIRGKEKAKKLIFLEKHIQHLIRA